MDGHECTLAHLSQEDRPACNSLLCHLTSKHSPCPNSMSFSGSKGNAALGDTAKGGSGGQVLIAGTDSMDNSNNGPNILFKSFSFVYRPFGANWYVFRKRITYHRSQKSCFSNTKNDLEKTLLYNLPYNKERCLYGRQKTNIQKDTVGG